MQKISPFLWFEDNAEEAVSFYVSIFKNAKITHTQLFSDDVPGPNGKVMTIAFELDGQQFTALNGGPVEGFKFSPAISFVIDCKDQDEVDYYWEKLSADPASEQCGWLKDKFGVSWQVVPRQLSDYLNGPDPEKSARAIKAMLKMKKLDLAELQKAYEG